MTHDDDDALLSPEGPDWPRLARDIASGDAAYARALADGTPRGAERAALASAFTAALHRPNAEPPTDADVERALADVLRRRGAIAMRVSAIRRAAGRSWRIPSLAAAALVIAAGGLYLAREPGAERVELTRGVVPTNPPEINSYYVSTTYGQVDSLRLLDGTLVVLGPYSSLTLETFGPTGPREVLLDGEAFFDVVHDTARAFVVHTARGVLRDVGTSFAVNSSAPAGLVVSVRTGAVAVSRTGAEARGARVVTAGDRATLPADGGSLRIERGTSSDDDFSFTRGHLALHDATVADIAAALDRWYGLELRVTDSSLLRRRVTATFGRESGPDAARIIAAAMGGVATISGDTLVTVSAMPTR